MKSIKKQYWLFQILGWGMLFSLHMFFAWFYGKLVSSHDQQVFLVRGLLFLVLGLLLTHLMRFVILKTKALEKPVLTQVIFFIAISIFTGFVAGTMEMAVLVKLNYLIPREVEVMKANGFWLMNIINYFSWSVYLFTWNSIYLMYHYITTYQRQKLDTLKLQSVVKELELQTIKSHINPHFIFNALNSIRALVDEDPGRARDAITELSNILRSSINIEKTNTVLLKDELSIVDDYLALERIRFEDRLKVSYEIQNETLDKPIPHMMLQTLVENAIKHGISQEIKGGRLTIITQIVNDHMLIKVVNTGMLVGELNNGFGLISIKERLKLLYGENAKFSIEQVDNSTVAASITIPLS